MINGFGMQKDFIRHSKPQACSVCNRIFLTPQDLILHFNSFHSNNHFSTFSSSGATPTTFRHYPHQNRNPNTGYPARNRFDLNYYRSGYLDNQGRFHKRYPPAPTANPAKKTNYLFPQQKKPRLMELFPATSSEGGPTLPLLGQLEQQKPEDTVKENDGTISSSIDLSLRL